MLKGLALRQTFLAVNTLLILFLGVGLAVFVSEFLAAPTDVGPVSPPPAQNRSGEVDLAGVRPLKDYDLIVKSNLFGGAARYDPSSKPRKKALTPTQPASELTEETKLPLKLLGTTVSGEHDTFAVAIIEVRQGAPRTKAFYLGQEIMPRVFLAEVRRKEVVLDNRINNRFENLKQEHTDSNTQPTATSRLKVVRRGTTSSVSSRPQMIILDRADITKRIEEEYARLASTIDIKVVKDDKGKIQGVTTDNIEDIELAAELGLQNGDVLTSINNEPVDSREKGAQILQKYRNASIFRLGILRDGRPMYINYRVR